MGKKGVCLVVGVVILCLGVTWLFLSCGGSSSSSDSDSGSGTSYSVTASVAVPTTANVSSSLKSVGLSKAITEEAAAGALVEAQDTAGNVLGNCTTGADGTCSVSLTAAQLEAGVVFAAANMHSFQQFDAIDIAAADAGTALAASINTVEDVVYALVAQNCGGSVAGCPATVDTDCLHDAVAVLPGDDDPGTDTVDGYVEGLIMAQARALVNNPSGATGALLLALGGDPTGYEAAVGTSTVSNVPVADAVANSQVGAGTVTAAYCTRPSAGAESPWETARAGVATVDTSTFSRAMAGMFEYFPPSELQQGLYPPAAFQGFMTAGPQLDGFFDKMGGSANDLARNAFVQGFKNGMFADPTNAPVAVGFIGATFPTPVNGVIPWTDNAYNPQTAVMAGRNAFVEMTNSGSFNPASFTPNMIYNNFQPAMSDPTRRTTFANGGCTDYVGAFMGNPAGFVPMDNFGQIKSPPGGSCTTSADCLPCDSCTNSVCVAGSVKMGVSCSTDSDCDQVTLCIGPPDSAYAGVAMKNCMCASAVPTGMGVYTGGGGAPQQYGGTGTGGYAPPAPGAQGGPCGPAQPCGAGLTCTGSQYGGVCVPGDFKFGPGAPCTGNSQCMSDTCSGGFCSGGGTGGACGTVANGLACMAPMDCSSCICNAGICAASGGGTKSPDGGACTSNEGCYSNLCDGGICKQAGGGAPLGSWCNTNEMCQSLHCNFGTMTCGA